MKPDPSPTATDDAFRPWLLAGVTALAVARVLLPSDGPDTSSEGPLFVLLTLVLAVAWALRGVMRRGTPARLGAVDVALAALVAWHSLAALLAARDAAPRPALNSLWQWVGLAAGFFLVRQLLRTEREARALVATLIALAVAEGAYGYHQFFVSMPADRELYMRDPDRALQEAGVVAPARSRQRALFEQRVNSTEPMGTFALANSLAGFLAPWMTVALGIVAACAAIRSRDARLWAPAVLWAVVILGCLTLTKSRAALLAGAVGIAGLFAWLSIRGARLNWRWTAGLAGAGVALAAVVAAGATWVGALDREVLSEAGKSLGYRLQYWQATTRMIAEHPWLGCGPGQFQSSYTRYKLPEASEVVADPHNFLFEVGSTAGIPALLAVVSILGLVAWRVARPLGKGLAHDAATTPARARGSAKPPAAPDASWHVLAGGAAGFVLALAVGPVADVPLSVPAFVGGLLVAVAVGASLAPWVRRGPLPASVLGWAALVLVIDLLAAGGISYAGVGGSLWLLTGVCLAIITPPKTLPTLAAVPLLGLAVLLAFSCYVSDYQPVLTSTIALDHAMADPLHAEKLLGEAAVADPLSAEPHKRLASFYWQQWNQHPTHASLERTVAALDEALALEPRSAALIEMKGDILVGAFERTGDLADQEQAVEAFGRAVELYPTSILTRGKLALALAELHRPADAIREAQEALDLDQATPHPDQKLPAEMRERLLALVREP